MSAQIRNHRKKLIVPIIVMGIITLIVGACSLESPKAPTWDTNLVMPLISKHYDMYELVDRMAEDALEYDSAGNFTLSFDQEVEPVVIDAGLSASAVSAQISHELGEISINSPDQLEMELVLEDYVSLSAGVVPDIGFDADKDFDNVTDFQSATFSEGELILAITNNFDLTIDSLTIWIIDNQSLDPIGEYFFEGGLAIGETKVDTVNLAGKSVTDDIGLSSRIHTEGGTLLTVSDKHLAVELGFSDEVTVSSAFAKVPAQNKEYSSSTQLNENHMISHAQLSSGNINIVINNNSELESNLSLVIAELSYNGDPLTIEAYIPANGSFNTDINLDGYDLEPDLNGSKMAFNIDVEANLPGSGEQVVEISSNDQFEVSATLSNIEFSQASGVIAPTLIELQTIEEEVDLPEGFENVGLSDAVMTLRLYSEFDIPAEVNVDLYGDGGQYLDISTEITGGSPANPGVTEVVVSDLNYFTNPVPHTITVSGSALAGDGVTSGTVYAENEIWGTINITSPLKFSLGETTVEGDINSTEIDSEDRDEISERLLEGTIHATLSNHLPFGCEVELYLSGDSNTLYSDPQLIIGPIEVAGGIVDAYGLVTSESASEITIHLSESDLDIVDNEVLYIGQYIYLPGTNNQVVSILSSDYLDIDAYLEVTARLGGEWD